MRDVYLVSTADDLQIAYLVCIDNLCIAFNKLTISMQLFKDCAYLWRDHNIDTRVCYEAEILSVTMTYFNPSRRPSMIRNYSKTR